MAWPYSYPYDPLNPPPAYHVADNPWLQGRYEGGQYPAQPAAPARPSRAQCRNQTLIGAAAGAGIAAAVSKPDAYKWSIPVGAVSGYLLGRHNCL